MFSDDRDESEDLGEEETEVVIHRLMQFPEELTDDA
jgi:hypothetical protein